MSKSIAIVIAWAVAAGLFLTSDFVRAEPAKPSTQPAKEFDFSCILYNVTVSPDIRVAKGAPEQDLVTAAGQLKECYGLSFCGIKMMPTASSGRALKAEAVRGKIGLALQVVLLGITDIHMSNFDVRHEMLMYDGKQWQTLFSAQPKSFPFFRLGRSREMGREWNPAEVSLLRAALPLKIEELMELNAGEFRIIAKITNKLPIELGNLRMTMPFREDKPYIGHSIDLPPEARLPAGSTTSVVFMARGLKKQMERDSNNAYIEFDLRNQGDRRSADSPKPARPAQGAKPPGPDRP